MIAGRPGNPKYKFILLSPYFFLYIISMSLLQAFLAAVSLLDIDLGNGHSIGSVLSLTFFIVYILEVCLRMYIKGYSGVWAILATITL